MPFNDTGKVDIVIGPLTLDVRQGTMPPDDIRLWEGNPRIKHRLAQLDTYPSQEDLIAAIERVQPTAFKNLYRDIEQFGQQEPVFLRAEATDGLVETATVIEGNTRVAILKDLHQRKPKDSRFAAVKAYLLPEGFDEKDQAILMANYHVKGTLRNQWDRYQIGAFLYEYVEVKRRFNQAEMAEYIGKSASWISRHLTVYKFSLEYKDEVEGTHGLSSGAAEDETNRFFSILEEAWKVKAFRDEMDRDVDAKETLFRWVHDRKFKDHRAIRAIYELYTNPNLRALIDEGGLGVGDDAAGQLVKSIPLHEDLERLIKRIDTVQLGDLDSIDRARVQRALTALTGLDAMLERLGKK